MIKENEDLLNHYLSGRRLSENSRICYDKAVKNYERFMEKSLADSSRPDFDEWYQRLCAKRYKPKSIWNYGTYLRHLYSHHLENLGLDENEVESRTKETFKGVPFRDLMKEHNRDREDREKLVSREELEMLIKTAVTPKVKAIITMLYESGCRKSEITDLRIRDVTFGDAYTEIRVKGKTGERTIPLFFSVPYLRAWLQVHPGRRPESPLFCSVTRGNIKPLGSSALGMSLRLICEKAGLRHIHPHMLRHTRLTELAKSGVGEFQLKSFAGWTPGSRMASRYIHLAGRDHLAPVLEAQGIIIDQFVKPKPLLSVEICPKCNETLGLDMMYCPSCGYVLDPSLRVEEIADVKQVRSEVDRLQDLIEEQREMIKQLTGFTMAQARENIRTREEFIESIKQSLPPEQVKEIEESLEREKRRYEEISDEEWIRRRETRIKQARGESG